MGKLPLEGIRVADFTWAIAGPATIRHLAIFGAEVIKIESRARPDGARLGNPFLEGRPGLNRSAYFANYSPSKQSVTLDLSKPEARDLAKRIVAVSDVATEAYSAGVMGRWGLDYDELKKVKPDLIMISLSMQGQTGPRATQIGFGRTLQALVGFDHLTGWPDRTPAGPNQPYTDLVAPWFGVIGLLNALGHRTKTGEGQYIDVAQYEASLHFLAPALLDYAANSRVEKRTGNRVGYAAPHGVYPCKGEDRWCAIAVSNDAQWSSLLKTMGTPSWATADKFSTFLGRKRHEDEMDTLLGQWTAAFEAGEVEKRLQSMGVPAAVVASGKDLHEDPQLAHRGYFKTVEHPTMGRRTYSTPSPRFSEFEPAIRPSPLLGQDNRRTMQELLGMRDEEFQALTEAKVIA